MPKPKLTKELEQEIIQLAASGATNADICDYIGVNESTFYRWLKNPKTEAEHKLCNDIKKAYTKRKLWHLRKIQQASENGAWQASAWYLERRYPREYAKPEVQLRVDMKPDQVQSASNDSLLGLAKQLEERAKNAER